jgi:hypothetical protein
MAGDISRAIYVYVGLAPVAKGTLGDLCLISRFNGGLEIPVRPNSAIPIPPSVKRRILGPEVPRTLPRGTPHAKPTTIKKLRKVGFKPNE